jgi:hypothetical protein
MPRTLLAATAIKTVKGPNPGTVLAGDLTVTPVAADVANGNNFVPAQNDVLHIQNTHATIAYTVTLTSAPDERKRLGTITAYNLPAGAIATFSYGDLIGWLQSDSPATVWLDANNASVVYWVERRA